jgi:hypothetical protein
MKLPRERLKRSRLFRFAARRLIRVLRPYVRLEHALGRRALWHDLVWLDVDGIAYFSGRRWI